MTGGSFKYLVKQGISNIWLNRLMALASIGILAACLILVGGAGLVSLNIQDIFHNIEGQNEMAVYIVDNATEAEIAALESRISALPEIASYRFETKEQALQNAMEQFGMDSLEDYIAENPMPASFWVTLHDVAKTGEVRSAIEGMPSVYSVNALEEVSDTLVGIERVLLIFGGVIIVILVIASMVVIANSIRLTVFARRREINIMKYVGATNGFIRFPFVVEGVTIGFIAAVLAYGIIFALYSGVMEILEGSAIGWVVSSADSIIPFSAVWFPLALCFFAGGVLIGAIGSSGAIRKHLKV